MVPEAYMLETYMSMYLTPSALSWICTVHVVRYTTIHMMLSNSNLLKLSHPTRDGLASLLPFHKTTLGKIIVEAWVVLVVAECELSTSQLGSRGSEDGRNSEDDVSPRLHDDDGNSTTTEAARCGDYVGNPTSRV
jgi:hypothetical protein